MPANANLSQPSPRIANGASRFAIEVRASPIHRFGVFTGEIIASGERIIAGRKLKISVSPHPSHLQLIPIISQGRARAKQASAGRGAVLPLLLHTDASFAGQGLVAEMLQLSQLPAFHLGGTLHIVINNQIGFTTNPDEGRSARFATDIGKLIEAPILHVNGDDPEAVQRVARVAAAYRTRFAADVLIDLVCYRRPGHNELDEPRFTQPAMYQAIDARPTVATLYGQALAAQGIDTAAAEAPAAALAEGMRAAFATAGGYKVNHVDAFQGVWAGLRTGTVADMLAFTPTGLPRERLAISFAPSFVIGTPSTRAPRVTICSSIAFSIL